MATATTAVATFVGNQTGRTYAVSVYTADTAAYQNTFNPNGAAVATSPQFWRPPENVKLIDFAIATGTTQTTAFLQQDGATKAGSILSYVACLNTSASRQKLNLDFPNGCLVGIVTI